MSVERRELRRKLFNLAAQQGGYFTAAQAKDVGYSYQAQAHHIESGNWERTGRGLFRLVEWVPESDDDLARWTLWSKGRAIVSHETALSVHGIGEFESALVHLTVPPGFSMRDDALALHFACLQGNDVLQQKGYRTTTASRSIIDIAATGVDDDQLVRAIQDALSIGAFTIRQLRSRAEAIDLKAALRIERAIQQLEAQ